MGRAAPGRHPAALQDRRRGARGHQGRQAPRPRGRATSAASSRPGLRGGHRRSRRSRWSARCRATCSGDHVRRHPALRDRSCWSAATATSATALPMLGLYAFAGLRLLPALQQIYTSLTALRFSPARRSTSCTPTCMRASAPPSDRRAAGPAAPMPAARAAGARRRALRLSRAPSAAPSTALDLSIPARTTVGIVGGTGAGKTTAVDVILGLLRPQRGALVVDGVPVDRRGRARLAERSIGYVPQQIFLTDDTVRANIAFGVEPEEIDVAAVRARRAHRRAARLRHRASCRRATRPCSASAACGCPAASASASASPARSTTTPTCWCSTRRPARSTTSPSGR